MKSLKFNDWTFNLSKVLHVRDTKKRSHMHIIGLFQIGCLLVLLVSMLFQILPLTKAARVLSSNSKWKTWVLSLAPVHVKSEHIAKLSHKQDPKSAFIRVVPAPLQWIKIRIKVKFREAVSLFASKDLKNQCLSKKKKLNGVASKLCKVFKFSNIIDFILWGIYATTRAVCTYFLFLMFILV